MVQRMRSILLMLLVFLFSWMPVLPVTAVDKVPENGIVRVGYYEDGDYMSCDQQGEYAGFNIEFVQELAKQSGLKFEIVDCISFTKAYDMLQKGEIDLLPAVYYTDERAAQIQFVTQPMCSIYITLNVRMDDDRYSYEDFEAFDDMKVGIIRDGVDGRRFREFCREHHVNLEIIDYDETWELLSALDDGTLDGVAITHLGKNSTYRSVAQFSPNPLYFAVAPGKTELLAELNSAMDKILLSNPGYTTDLYDKYLGPSSNQKPVFTKSEREYLALAGAIKVSFDPDFAPLSYQDKKTGEFKGVCANIFEAISQYSGLQFEYEAHPQSEALELQSKGAIDILCISDGDYLWDRRNHLNSTLYYLSTPVSMITKHGVTDPKTPALLKGYGLSETIAKDYQGSKILYYASAEECLEAVEQGRADVAYLHAQAAGNLLNGSKYGGLSDTTLGQYISKLCVGVSDSEDPRLFSVIDKCIQYLPVEAVDAYVVENTMADREVTLAEFVSQHIWAVIGSVCLVLGIIIMLISHNLRNALRSNRRVQELLYKDDLTGLYSINGFYHNWEDSVKDTARWELALLCGDICDFKLINDNFGFAVGDKVLCACSRILQDILDEGEYCARVSADNFVLLMQYDGWDHLVARLKSCVGLLDDWRKENTEIPYRIDLVFGVYLVKKSDDQDVKQIIDFASYARRYAKKDRDYLALLYDEHMRSQAILARELESGLDDAIRENQFAVYYQPKVVMDDGKIIGSEALIRWNHPQKGFLTPGVFVPIFEKTGMIRKVDFWLFEEVCRTMNRWKEEGVMLMPVSCNFSRTHFEQQDFPERVSQVADRWGIPRKFLEIEITESALLEDTAIIDSMLPRLKALGFRVSIDDFGSGYSSLGQLQHLAADVLKLDRSFVSHSDAGDRAQIVVEHVINMAKELGMTVICEGVEAKTQVEILCSMGCRFAQGFYFYRPVPQEEYERLIKEN